MRCLLLTNNVKTELLLLYNRKGLSGVWDFKFALLRWGNRVWCWEIHERL